MILSLCKGLSFFKFNINNYYNIIYELLSYILKIYINQKNNENKDFKCIYKSLYIYNKFMKYIDKEIKSINLKDNKDYESININNRFELINANFYNIIIQHHDKIYNLILNIINSNKDAINYSQIFDLLVLYMKIFKYNLNYLGIKNREKILIINYDLNLAIFNQIINNNSIKNQIIKYYIDIISLINKIINKYLSTHIYNLALNIIKNYSFYFYSFISNDNLFKTYTNFFKLKDNIDKNNIASEVLKGEYDEKCNIWSNSKLKRFIFELIDFFYLLIDLIYNKFPEYKMISKNDKNNSNSNSNFKEINDYIDKEFLTKDNIKFKSILLLAIRKYLIFNDYEMHIAQENFENFYLCFTECSSLYDIKEKSGAICNLFYSIFRKKIMIFSKKWKII